MIVKEILRELVSDWSEVIGQYVSIVNKRNSSGAKSAKFDLPLLPLIKAAN